MDWFTEKVHSSVEDSTGCLLEECLAATRSLLAAFHSAVKQRGRHPVVRATHSSSETFGSVSVSVCLCSEYFHSRLVCLHIASPPPLCLSFV